MSSCTPSLASWVAKKSVTVAPMSYGHMMIGTKPTLTPGLLSRSDHGTRILTDDDVDIRNLFGLELLVAMQHGEPHAGLGEPSQTDTS